MFCISKIIIIKKEEKGGESAVLDLPVGQGKKVRALVLPVRQIAK